jgi:hypothetical protein
MRHNKLANLSKTRIFEIRNGRRNRNHVETHRRNGAYEAVGSEVSVSWSSRRANFFTSLHPFHLTILAVLASVVTLCVTPCSIENRKRELSVIVFLSFLAWRGSWTVAVRHMI